MFSSSVDKFAEFFKDTNLLVVTDAMARRYGITPYEALNKMSMFEFSFNVAVMSAALKSEQDKADGKKSMKSTKDWKSLGIKRTVVKKGQKNGTDAG